MYKKCIINKRDVLDAEIWKAKLTFVSADKNYTATNREQRPLKASEK